MLFRSMFSTLIGFLLQAIRHAWMLRRRWTSALHRSVAFGVLAYFPAMFMVMFMAGIFDQRYGNIMMAFMFAYVAITGKHAREARAQYEQQPAV